MTRNVTRERVSVLADNFIREITRYGVKVMRYDSYSTSSVYLKMDYGLLNTIRISDHKGKKKYKYRYNIITCDAKYRKVEDKGFVREYFPEPRTEEDLLAVVKSILQDKENKISELGEHSYTALKNYQKINNRGSKGFWSKAREI